MTDDGRTLLTLVLIFVPLSLVSVGGGPAVFAEIQQQAVVIQGWTSEREFAGLFGISRAAPGPGVLLVTLLGWKAAGWAGALVASLAFFVPSSLVIYGVARIWNRYRGTGWHTATEAGFAPIAVGLVFAGALAILRSGGNGAGLAWAVAIGVAACRIWRPSVHPLLLLAVGAAVFALSAVKL
jgi:chromate transporter